MVRALTILLLALVVQSLSAEVLDIGGCDDVNSSYFAQYFEDDRRITYCEGGDTYLGAVSFKVTEPSSYLGFSYAGYPERDGLEIRLEDAQGKARKLDLANARESWRTVVVALDGLVFPITLIAEDQSDQIFGWIGLGNISTGQGIDFVSWPDYFTSTIKISLLYILFTVLLAILLRLTQGDLEQSVILLVLVIGVLGWVAFWVFYLTPELGRVGSYSFLFVTLALLIRSYIHDDMAFWRECLIASSTLIWVPCLVLLILTLGYFPFDQINTTFAANRWHSMPVDNQIPLVFAGQILSNEVSSPMIGDWLSSDRPPLQTGLILFFNATSESSYSMISTWLQALVVLPILAIAKRLGGPISLSLLAVVFSAGVTIHTLFVWPKLLSATFQICFLYFMLVISKEVQAIHRGTWIFGCGIAAALAMLSHGSSVFTLLGVVVTWILMKDKAWKDVCLAGIVALVVYAPWLGYQKLIDPPGDRLIKWHLAGQVEVNEESLGDVLQTQYQSLSISEWLLNKQQSLMVIIDQWQFYLDLSDVLMQRSTEEVQWTIYVQSFFHTFYSMWFLSPFLILLVLVPKVRAQTKDLDMKILVSIVSSFVIWILLMFDAGSTVVHQGPMMPWLLLIILTVRVLSLCSMYLALLTVSANVACWYWVMVLNLAKYPLEVYQLQCLFTGALLVLTLIWSTKNYSATADHCPQPSPSSVT